MVRQYDRRWQDGFRCGWFIAERRVRSGGVVMVPPAFDQSLGFAQVIEYFSGKQLVAELGVEALAIAILPWACGRNVKRLHPNTAKPLAQGCSYKLWPIIRPDMLRWSVLQEQFKQNLFDNL